jgi:hypothetical protein
LLFDLFRWHVLFHINHLLSFFLRIVNWRQWPSETVVGNR